MECLHDACTCRTTDGDEYCSPGCQSDAQMDLCPCGHEECAANSMNAEEPLT